MTDPVNPSSNSPSTHSKSLAVVSLNRDSEMALAIKDMDWSTTSLGVVGGWPQALVALVNVILVSTQPMFVAWGPEHTLLYNDAYAQILASKHPGALGRRLLDVWDEISDDLAPIVQSTYDGHAVTMENIPLLIRRKGYLEEAHFAFSYTPVHDAGGNIGGFFCACMETTSQVFAKREQQRAEEALRVLNDNLEQQIERRTLELNRLWELSPDLMLVIDFNGVFLQVNPAWTAVLGYLPDELVGHHVNEFVVQDDHSETVDAYTLAANGGLPRLVNRYRHKDGSLRWISWVAAPASDATYANGRDITVERQQADALAQAEEALRQSQKLDAIGQLTGGVAHDFNNLLTVVRSSVDMLKRPGLPDARRSRYITAISDTVDRAAKLTAQLLAFARRQALKPAVFAACDSVRSLTTMLNTLAGPLVEIVTNLPINRCFVEADPGQFDTALVNIAANARDAIEGRGRVTISVEAVDFMPVDRGRGSLSGAFVAVTISDTGVGIPDEQLEQIFEPFFTTKQVGKGTGLGLSQVFGFAKQSGGGVTVESSVGIGSSFTLYLPRVAQPASFEPVKEPNILAEGHGTSVLVVEDNIEVGEAATQSLSDLGYLPVWVTSAEAALEELAIDVDRFDVVFSDVVMPGMNGVDLAHHIRQAHPALPILLTSGYSHVLSQHGSYGFDLLHKPYSIGQLAEHLHKVVTSASGGRDMTIL